MNEAFSCSCLHLDCFHSLTFFSSFFVHKLYNYIFMFFPPIPNFFLLHSAVTFQLEQQFGLNIRFRFTCECMRWWFLCIQSVTRRWERMEEVLLVILSVIDKLTSATNRDTRLKSLARPCTVMHTEWTGHKLVPLSLAVSLSLYCVWNMFLNVVLKRRLLNVSVMLGCIFFL